MILRMLRVVVVVQNKCSFNGIFDFEVFEIWMMLDVNKEFVILDLWSKGLYSLELRQESKYFDLK